MTAILLLFLIAWQPPEFEVASIRLSTSDPSSSGSKTDKGRMSLRNVTLKRCMRSAYGLPEVQIFGVPKGLEDTRFDIDAKAAGPAGDAELSLMLRALLADRFRLVVHRETRPLSGFVLTVAKGGIKAKRSAPDSESRGSSGRARIECQACTMAQLTIKLSESLKLPVSNATDTEGQFDFVLEWTPDEAQGSGSLDKPSLFTVLQEQLGLRLESRKVPAEVLVIDRAELPSEN
jgi:uncharacterized protein (TIGR03435 family)